MSESTQLSRREESKAEEKGKPHNNKMKIINMAATTGTFSETENQGCVCKTEGQ